MRYILHVIQALIGICEDENMRLALHDLAVREKYNAPECARWDMLGEIFNHYIKDSKGWKKDAIKIFTGAK